MRKLIISKKLVHDNKQLKENRRNYLREHRTVRGRYPKARLGKIVTGKGTQMIDCTEESQEMKAQQTLDSADAILEAIRQSQVVGRSGSGFPAIEKIETVRAAQANKKYLVVNAVACDPGLIHDAWLLEHEMDMIERGIAYISQCIPFETGVIGSPDNVPARYPMGAEKILIQQLPGIELSREDIPAKKGILVLNVQTVYAIGKALSTGMGAKERFLTIANLDNGRASVAKVREGQTIEDILAKAAVSLTSTQKLYAGMGVMDAEQVDKQDKVSLQTNLIALASQVPDFHNDAKCRGCGGCTHNCPMGVQVSKVMKEVEKASGMGTKPDMQKLTAYGVQQCIQCGTCSYVCKAGKDTMEIIKTYL